MSKLSVNRRSFLKAGAAVAGAAAIGSIPGINNIAKASGGKPPQIDTDPAYSKAVPPVETINDVESQGTFTPKWGQPKELVYEAPPANYECKLVKERDRGGARFKYVEHNERWLGTTEITGEVKRRSSYSDGYGQFYAGLTGTDETRNGKWNSTEPTLRAQQDVRNLLVSKERGPVADTKIAIPDPELMSKHIKDYGYSMHIDEIGIGKTPEAAIYTDVFDWYAMGKADNTTPYLPYCIVMTCKSDLRQFLSGDGTHLESINSISLSYIPGLTAATVIAQYIRNLGYQAYVSNKESDMMMVPPMEIAAGFGELARGGIVMSPRFGTKLNPIAIMTDLPLVPDKPIDAGIRDFCRVCKKCAEECPAQAIPYDTDPTEHNGYLSWATDIKKCAQFMLSNYNGNSCCSVCVNVCPWSSKEESWFHEAGVFIGSSGETGSALLKQVDDLFGYGTEVMPQYRWFLEWPELHKY